MSCSDIQDRILPSGNRRGASGLSGAARGSSLPGTYRDNVSSDSELLKERPEKIQAHVFAVFGADAALREHHAIRVGSEEGLFLRLRLLFGLADQHRLKIPITEHRICHRAEGAGTLRDLPVLLAIDAGKGDPGDPGADAITMTVTSSNGTIFKNTAVVTTLTAHVYKAGTELTAAQIAELGTIKWYKDGSSTALSTTGATLNISSGDVTNKATYIAQLEG